jgi:hypothetical protein
VPAVTTRTFYRRRAERFAQLLNEANGGRRHHVRSHVDNELAELVAVGNRIRAARPAVEVEPDFRTGLRAMLIATAERDGIGATAGAQAAPGARPSAARATRRKTLNSPRTRARGAILIGIAAGAIAVSGMSAASENAVPGDPLYGMKRSTERAQLALATSDLSRGQLFLGFARTRLAEAVVVRGDAVGFATVLDDMDADTRLGVKLLTTSAVQRDEAAALDVIGRFVTGHRAQVTSLLDGASQVERERIAGSLGLLDQIKRRADGLRAGLTCGGEQSSRADALGPLPRTCADARPSTGSQAGTPTPDQRTVPRSSNSPRRDRTEQPSAPGTRGTGTVDAERSKLAPPAPVQPGG